MEAVSIILGRPMIESIETKKLHHYINRNMNIWFNREHYSHEPFTYKRFINALLHACWSFVLIFAMKQSSAVSVQEE